jgi:DNA helicase-2/ATP-dependent DNA helicase PcrA
VDFAELLLRSYELLANHPDLLSAYQGRFRQILVDEFQDTNRLQYRWIQLLAGDACGIFVVGDDDQSIYGWRGAEVANIRDFVETMIPCQLVRLEQNYRSTQSILNAANSVISRNTGRMGKNLWSSEADGDKLSLYTAINEFDEARFLAEQLQHWQRQGERLSDCCILYRSNHQSRVLEQVLNRESIPYKVTGGMRFFERAEVKDALAYARLLLNAQDDAAFMRVINVPPRGIGDKSIEKIQAHAQQHQQGLFASLQTMVIHGGLSGKTLAGASEFLALFQSWQALGGQALASLMQRIVRDSGLWAFYGQEGLTGDGRKENLEELINAAAQYEQPALDSDEPPLDPLLHFLTQTTLDSGEKPEPEQDRVNLMTIHAAKGLEFGWVAVTGLEEGIFPLSRAGDDGNNLEEERRLMYVAMTRARRQLILTHCGMRRFHGNEQLMQPSRFIKEIPAEWLNTLSGMRSYQRTASAHTPIKLPTSPTITPSNTDNNSPFSPGSRVVHPRFGKGLVLAVDGMGDDGRVQVKFCDSTRWLLLSVAKLEKWEGCQ